MAAALLLSQLPSFFIAVIAGIVAVLVIKGPARWLALVGILLGLLAGIVVFAASVNPDGPLRHILLRMNTGVGIVADGLLVAAIIVGHRWARRPGQQPPVMPR